MDAKKHGVLTEKIKSVIRVNRCFFVVQNFDGSCSVQRFPRLESASEIVNVVALCADTLVSVL